MNTLNQEDSKGSTAHKEKHGEPEEGREGARHRFPPSEGPVHHSERHSLSIGRL